MSLSADFLHTEKRLRSANVSILPFEALPRWQHCAAGNLQSAHSAFASY